MATSVKRVASAKTGGVPVTGGFAKERRPERGRLRSKDYKIGIVVVAMNLAHTRIKR
jgi:hypothetical protein